MLLFEEGGAARGVYPDMDPDAAALAGGLCEDVHSSLDAELGGSETAGVTWGHKTEFRMDNLDLPGCHTFVHSHWTGCSGESST